MKTTQLTLTHFERKALSLMLNLADGYVRRAPTPTERAVMDDLQALYKTSLTTSPLELESVLVESHLALFGQTKPKGVTPYVFFSGSEALDVMSQCLAADCKKVVVIEPTFDPTPNFLCATGMTVAPVAEELLHYPARLETKTKKFHALIVTLPNNPSGITVNAKTLADIARRCAKNHTALVIDASFRAYDAEKFDYYTILTATPDLDWIVIEDTGKLWATNGLKAGMLLCSARFQPKASELFHSLVLSISPFVLTLLGKLTKEAGAKAVQEITSFVESNRTIIREGLQGHPIFQIDSSPSHVSLERIFYDKQVLPHQFSFIERLAAKGLAVTGSESFYWADSQHRPFLRLALSRDKEIIEQAVTILASVKASMA